MKRFLISSLLMLAALSVFALAPTSMALISPSDAPSLIQQQTGGEGDVKSFANTIINFALLFLGFICVVVIIYSGFLYVTSAVDEEATGKAKTNIINAIIGIVLIMASFAIVNTVLKAPTQTGGAAVTSP